MNHLQAYNLDEWHNYLEQSDSTDWTLESMQNALQAVTNLIKKRVPARNFVYQELNWVQEDLERNVDDMVAIKKQLSNLIYSHLHFGI